MFFFSKLHNTCDSRKEECRTGVWNRESEVAGPGIYQVVQCWGDSVVNIVGPPGEPMKFISELSTQETKRDTFIYWFLSLSTGQG